MLFWITVAVLTALVAVVFLLPLMRGSAGAVADAPHEVAVYRDQMKEIARDLDSGLIGADEAANARAEIGRRLLAAEGGAAPVARTGGRTRLAEIVILILIPAIGLPVYLTLGQPDMPAAPLAARLENPGDDMNLLVAMAERHLAEKPEDGAGWDKLAPIYYRSRRRSFTAPRALPRRKPPIATRSACSARHRSGSVRSARRCSRSRRGS